MPTFDLRPVDPARTLGPSDGQLAVRGLDGRVVIHRDRWGIPHVEATTVADLFFGQGFATAVDRLWHLEHDRRRAAGRLAELVGPGPAVATDLFHRRARVADAARRGYGDLDPDTRAVVDAHTAGVNAFLESSDARPIELQALGADVEPWEPWQAVAVFLARHVCFATWQTKLWRARVAARFGAEAMLRWRSEGPPAGETVLIAPPGAPASLTELAATDLAPALQAIAELGWSEPDHLGISGASIEVDLDDGAAAGSNAWVVDGSRTASGRPILAGDSHRAFETPNVYYQLHLRGPGIDAAGFSFPGVPGILHFGQSPTAAWAVTNAMAEYQDLYVERFQSTESGVAYEADGEWAPADVRTETVSVRGADPVTVTSVVTRNGPVVVGDPASGSALALASTGLQSPGGSLRCLLPLLRARTVEELDAAVTDWVEPVNSFVLADDSGAIGYRVGGKIPVRHPAAAWLPVPGWAAEHQWRGVVADADLPRLRNPEGGAIATANNRVVPPDHQVLVGVSPAGPHRAARIWHRLADRSTTTVADHAAVHNDAVSVPLHTLAGRVAGLDPRLLGSEEGRWVRDQLQGWDGAMAPGSVPACLAASVRHELVRSLASRPDLADLASDRFTADEPPATAVPVALGLSAAVHGLLTSGDLLLAGGSLQLVDEQLAVAVEAAVASLADELGGQRDQWTWGRRHLTSFAHPFRHLTHDQAAGLLEQLTPTPRGVAGDRDCVRSTSSYPGISLHSIHGSVTRYVWDLGDRSASRWVVPLGASGNPASPHHADQHDAWVEGELVPVVTDARQVTATATATLTLTPTSSRVDSV